MQLYHVEAILNRRPNEKKVRVFSWIVMAASRMDAERKVKEVNTYLWTDGDIECVNVEVDDTGVYGLGVRLK